MTCFTNIRDLDRYLLRYLSNYELIKISQVNLYFRNVVCNEEFFKLKLASLYPDTLKYYNTMQTWKQYFFETCNLINKINKIRPDLNYKYKYGNPLTQYTLLNEGWCIFYLFTQSVDYGELALIEFILKSKYRLSKSIKKTALFSAIKKGNKTLVDFLLEWYGYLINYHEAIIRAVCENQLEIVKYLFECEAILLGNPQSKIQVNLDEAFFYAANRENLPIIKYLVEHGANIHHYSDYALKHNICRKNTEIVKYLILKGADTESVKEKDHIDFLSNLNYSSNSKRRKVDK